ncbi:YdcF family protein [Commensalibacter nepenthis]|uniref:YdcF family protein n=1 Tax=Commensalibacter nepenthis TaxID=3043872 RepID=A0ABT6Q617_9PROT|nr:YdcF family protein [Commensalibacter sp. TBRC 10068]MDI2112348.1 YdcF family protein [Commensalibacter sp. TBRC 10068]
MDKPRLQSKWIIVWGIVGIFLVWGFGFIVFVIDTLTYNPSIPNAQGIVVLTGGAKRIENAIKLLQSNHGKYLLISGVPPTTHLDDIERILPFSLTQHDRDHITLGHNATSTMGNAIETAAWAHYYHLDSLIIVTSSYHIRRAIVEMQSLLENVKLYPYVARNDKKETLSHLHSMRLLFLEYNKFLAAYTGLIHTTRPKEDFLKNTP